MHKHFCHKKPEVENSATGTVTALFMAVRVIVLTMRQRKADMFVSVLWVSVGRIKYTTLH